MMQDNINITYDNITLMYVKIMILEILKYLYFWEENKTKFIIIIKIIRMRNKTYDL